MKTSIAIFLCGFVALTSAGNGAVRAVKEKDGKAGNTHHKGNMTQTDIEESIYVPNEFVDEFEDMIVEPFNEDEMGFDSEDFDDFDEDDRRALYKKKKYKVLYCYKYKKGGKYYRKLEISQDDIKQSEDIIDQERDLELGYDNEGKYGGHKYKGRHGRCVKWHRHICCYKKHHHKHYNHRARDYKEDDYRF